jgi:hypothetical protein
MTEIAGFIDAAAADWVSKTSGVMRLLGERPSAG